MRNKVHHIKSKRFQGILFRMSYLQ